MKARILVIEDEPAINNLLCMNLEVTGYQTVSYLDGNDASEGIAWDHEFQVLELFQIIIFNAPLWILCSLEKMDIPFYQN